MTKNLPLAQAWFRKAEKDLAAAVALTASAELYDAATFHTQQAAEKYLKGYLAFCGVVNIPKTHNLLSLYKLCRNCVDVLTIDAELLSELTVYAVETRYDLAFSPDDGVVKSAAAAAQTVKSAVLSAISKIQEQEAQE